jgi:hypothetical protein
VAVVAAFFSSSLSTDFVAVIPISFSLGAGIGLIAGATGNPLVGGSVGTVLGAMSASVTVFPLLILSCLFSLQNGRPGGSPEAYVVAVAFAGGLSGVVGGAVGMSLNQQNSGSAADPTKKDDDE